MITQILFEEVQQVGHRQTNRCCKVLTAMFLAFLLVNLVLGKGMVTNLTQGLFAGLLVCLVAAVFTGARMVTQIREDGVYVRFPPFRSSFNRYAWQDVRDVYVREYQALPEYTGWGMKIGPSGLAYIVSGSYGIQLSLNEGPDVLIGTQQPEKAREILNTILQS